MLTFRRSCIAVLLAVVAALAIVQATATAKPKPPPKPLPQTQYDPATESDEIVRQLWEYIDWYRDTFRIPGTQNIAAYHYKYPNGADGFFAIHSDPTKSTPDAPKGHSERRIAEILKSVGIDTDTVDNVATEFEPCISPAGTASGTSRARSRTRRSPQAPVSVQRPEPSG